MPSLYHILKPVKMENILLVDRRRGIFNMGGLSLYLQERTSKLVGWLQS